MKKLIALTLCLLLLAGCAVTYDGPKEYRDVVWSVTEEHYDSGGDVAATYITSYAYDIYGNPAQRIVNTAEGDISKTLSKYDNQGRLLEQRDYDLTDWFPFADSVSTYTYDDQGRITRTEHRSGFEKNVITYTYDDKANTRTVAYESGLVMVYFLDEKGWTVHSEQTDAAGQVRTEEYTRDAEGKLLHSESFLNGRPESMVEYTYDDQGRELRWTETKDGQITASQRREYGPQQETVYHDDGSKTILYYVDEACEQLSSQSHYDSAGNLTYRSFYAFTRIAVPGEGGEIS